MDDKYAASEPTRRMEVCEQFVRGKWGDTARCEDVIVVTEDFAAVLDGVTDIGPARGRWAAETVAAAIAALPPDVSCAEAVAWMSAALGEQSRTRSSAGACVAVYSRARRQVWRVGDCTVRIGTTVHAGRMALDDVMLKLRVAYIGAIRLAGASDAEAVVRAEALVEPLWRLEHHYANLDGDNRFAYGVIDGTPVPARHQEVFDVGEASEVVLASDGYPAVLATLAESEAYLADDLVADPLRVGAHPAYRAVAGDLESFDDRAYLRLLV